MDHGSSTRLIQSPNFTTLPTNTTSTPQHSRPRRRKSPRWLRLCLCVDSNDSDDLLGPLQVSRVVRVDRFPFTPGVGGCPRHVMCVQGNDVKNGTHKGPLRYSFDFLLASGTVVNAVADGVVAVVVDCFGEGGMKFEHKARANLIAIQHDGDWYSRYVHLHQGSALVRVGDHVVAGQAIAQSGNSGYSSGAHLHFDVVDFLLETAAELAITVPPQHSLTKPTTTPTTQKTTETVSPNGREELGATVNHTTQPTPSPQTSTDTILQAPCMPALFSAQIPRETLTLQLVAAEPIFAASPLTNSDEIIGKACFLLRGECTFEAKIKHVLDARPACIVVGNDAQDEELFAMGGLSTSIDVPVVMVPASVVRVLLPALQKHKTEPTENNTGPQPAENSSSTSTATGEPPQLLIHLRERNTRVRFASSPRLSSNQAPAHPAKNGAIPVPADSPNSHLIYLYETLPIQFRVVKRTRKGEVEKWIVPKTGSNCPPQSFVAWATNNTFGAKVYSVERANSTS